MKLGLLTAEESSKKQTHKQNSRNIHVEAGT